MRFSFRWISWLNLWFSVWNIFAMDAIYHMMSARMEWDELFSVVCSLTPTLPISQVPARHTPESAEPTGAGPGVQSNPCPATEPRRLLFRTCFSMILTWIKGFQPQNIRRFGRYFLIDNGCGEESGPEFVIRYHSFFPGYFRQKKCSTCAILSTMMAEQAGVRSWLVSQTFEGARNWQVNRICCWNRPQKPK